MASKHSSQSARRSDNRADYRAAFLQRVHRLLQLAFESLNPKNYVNSEEDDITGDLCKHMKFLTETKPAERWMARFSIHDQDPSNDVPSAETGRPRKGKYRPKIDVRIVCKHKMPNRGYCIEAKRLYRSDSVSEYVDDEGLGAFISGDYAKDDSFGGMLGYVQSGSITDWLPKIEIKLGKHTSIRKPSGTHAWTSTSFPRGPRHCFTSSHTRNSGRDIVIVHVLFVFSDVG